MTDFQKFSDAPLTHPVTRLTTPGNRGNVAHVEPSREPTIWSTPQTFPRPLARRQS